MEPKEQKNILNRSTINNEKNLLQLPVEKLDEYIALLTEFQQKSENEAKFVEADLAQKKKDQEEEEKRIQHFYDEKNKLAIEKEQKEELKKKKDKYELKKYLDMQIEERKKEEDFLKSLDYEQARIWAIDCKKYNEDEKAIENKIKEMNKRNMDSVMEQINKKKNKKNGMNDTEYAMNRNILEKAKASFVKSD